VAMEWPPTMHDAVGVRAGHGPLALAWKPGLGAARGGSAPERSERAHAPRAETLTTEGWSLGNNRAAPQPRLCRLEKTGRFALGVPYAMCEALAMGAEQGYGRS
jgi:hypothetical protein